MTFLTKRSIIKLSIKDQKKNSLTRRCKMVNKNISEYRDNALCVCDVMDEHKGENILLIDVAGISSVTDYFVLVTATSKPHAQALMEKIEEAMEKNGLRIMRRDGVGDGRWIVVDFGSIVVHIFTQEVREFYNIEKLWVNGKNAMTMQDIQKLREKEEKVKADAIKKEEKAKADAIKKEEKAKQIAEKKAKTVKNETIKKQESKKTTKKAKVEK